MKRCFKSGTYAPPEVGIVQYELEQGIAETSQNGTITDLAVNDLINEIG